MLLRVDSGSAETRGGAGLEIGQGCDLCWGGGREGGCREVAEAEVRLHTALALAKIRFAQGQMQRELVAPAGRLFARTLAPPQNSPEEGLDTVCREGSQGSG